MKKEMTKQEFLDSKIKDIGLTVVKNETGEWFLTHSNQFKCIGINLEALDIELIPDRPPITIKNLGRFMAKFGDYPLAEFKGPYGVGFPAGERVLSVCCKDSINYVCSEHYCWPVCEITDERWTIENLGEVK